MARLDERGWDVLLPRARAAHLLARLALDAEAADVAAALPRIVRRNMKAAKVVAARSATTVRWEVDRVRRALSSLDVPVVLLKGAAYLVGNLPAARGRVVSDVDIMVPFARLAEVERALADKGWLPATEASAYDDSYYRRWMHELPPLVHRERGTVLDVHHAILPKTSRLQPSPEKLWAAAVALDEDFRVLSPVDMVVHAAVHLFRDGEIRGALRDLVLLRDLMQDFGAAPNFWTILLERAEELGAGRPCFYAVRFAHTLLDLHVPSAALQRCAKYGPPRPGCWLMDGLVKQSIAPEEATSASAISGFLLYVRSHSLRMPPQLLLPHLLHKWGARLGVLS